MPGPQTITAQATRRTPRKCIAIALTAFVGTVLVQADPLPVLDCILEPSEIVDVGSAVAGVLEVVTVDRGDNVVEGAVVARLESGVEEAAERLARARAQLDTSVRLRRASAEFFARNQERSTSLTQQDAISRQQLDQLDTEARVADLQVRQEMDNKRLANLEHRRATEALKRRSISSPINGVVIERFKSVGEYVEDTPVLRIAKLDPLYVETIVPVELLGRIRAGMNAQVTPAVPGHASQIAVVSRVDRVADAASGTFGVRLTIANPNGDIATGVRCSVAFSEALADIPYVDADAGKTDERQCFAAGPISGRDRAERLVAQLSAAGADVEVRERPNVSESEFFVVTDKSRDVAAGRVLLAKLETAGVADTQLMLRGDYPLRVSLGLYSNRQTAERRLAQVENKGFSVHVVRRHPNRVSLWLDIAGDASMDTDALGKIFESETRASVTTAPCSARVAGLR